MVSYSDLLDEFAESIQEYEDYDDDDNSVAPKPEYLNQTLDAPLLDLPLIKLSWALGRITEEDAMKRLRGHTKMKSEEEFINDTDYYYSTNSRKSKRTHLFSYQTILDLIDLSRSIPAEKTLPIMVSKLAISLSQDLSASLKLWGIPNKVNYDLTGCLDEIAADPLLRKYFLMNSIMEKVYDIRRAASLKADTEITFCESECFDIALSGRLFRLNFLKADGKAIKKAVYGSLDMFLCLLDLMRIRMTTRLAIFILKKDRTLLSLVEKQYEWQENCLKRYGNLGFEIGKNTEGLWKSWTSRISGGSYSSPDSFDRMVEKIKQKELTIREELGMTEPPSEFLADSFKMLSAEVLSVENAVELFGVMKSFGHPVINPEEGGASARDHAKAGDASRETPKAENNWMLQHLILKNYIKKHSKWPDMTYYIGYESQLEYLHNSGALYISDDSYPLADWRYASIEKIFDFNYNLDYLPLLKDKSCAPPLYKMHEFYKNRNVDKATRRILQVMLKSEHTDPEHLIHMFADDVLDDNEYCIFLYPKECEHKVKARMFCMLTFHMRLILSIIQENIKESVFPLLPYQSMTMDQAELIKSLLKMTKNSALSLETLFIEIDFSRWNLQFRDSHLFWIRRSLDSMFGVKNIFGRVHQVFKRAKVAVFVADQRIPQFEEGGVEDQDSDTMWDEHDGGFEGIDQATWTVSTICMIYLALWGEKCDFMLLGQGDNQTLAITRHPGSTEDITVFSQRIMKKIEVRSKSMNQIAKPEEFVDSTTTLTYSKMFIVKGQIIPMELKFAGKISAVTSSEVPSISDALGGIYSAAIGSAQNSRDPLLHWCLAGVLAGMLFPRVIRRGAWLGEPAKLTIGSMLKTESSRVLALTIPSVLGGFPISSPGKFMCRNEPDPLTSELAWLRLFAANSQPHRNYLYWLSTPEPYHETITSYDKLITDPFSLPFIQPRSQRAILDEAALSEIKSSSRNYDIREATSFSGGSAELRFISTLSTMTPFHPTLAHDLYKISIFGKVAELKKMFTLTRTFITQSRDGSMKHLLLQDAELRASVAVLLRFEMANKVNINTVPARMTSSGDLADSLRSRWQVKGGMIGISTSHPLDYTFSQDPLSLTGVQAFLPSLDGEGKKFMMDLGKFRPYLGSKTLERRVGKKYEIVESRASNELKKLVLLSSAADFSPEFLQVVSAVAESRSSYPLAQLQSLFPKMIGGIVAHRYEMLDSQSMIGPVGNSRLNSHIKICTDNIPGLSGGKVDYPVAFQQYFSYLIAGAKMSEYSGGGSGYYTILLSVDHLKPLISEQIGLNVKFDPSTIPQLSHNPLIHVSELSLKNENDRVYYTDISKEQIISFERFLESGHRRTRDLLINIFLTWLTNKKSSVEHRHITQAEGVMHKLDVSVASICGPELIIEATVWATVILTISHLVAQRIYSPSYERIDYVIDCYLKELLGSWAHLVSRDRFDEYLTEQGLWVTAVGDTAGTLRSKSLAVSLTRKVKRLLRCESDLSSQIPKFVFFSGSALRSKFDTYCEMMCLHVWLLYQQYYRSDDVSPSFETTVEKYLRFMSNRPNELPEGIQAEMMIVKLIQETDSFDWLDIFKYVRPLEAILREGVFSIKSSVEEALRVFRTLAPSEVLVIAGQTPISEIAQKRKRLRESISVLSPTFKAIPRGGLTVSYPRNLDSVVQPDNWKREYIIDRTRKHTGVYSTAVSNWARVISSIPRKTNTLVVGTGAGGIQAALADLNVESVGVDLRSTIPGSELGNYNYRPPELTRVNGKGRLSPVCHTTSGDILEKDNLQLAIKEAESTGLPVTNIIIDVEAGKKRYGFELVDKVITSGYRGRLHTKFFLQPSELGWMFSALNSVSSVVTCNVLRPLRKDETSPCIFSFDLDSDKLSRPLMIQEIYNAEIIDQLLPPHGPTYRDDRLEVFNYMLALCPIDVKPDFEAPQILLNALNEGGWTGKLEQENELSKAWILTTLIDKLQTIDEDKLPEFILSQSNKRSWTIPVTGYRRFKSIGNDRWLKSMIEKTVPRFYKYGPWTRGG